MKKYLITVLLVLLLLPALLIAEGMNEYPASKSGTTFSYQKNVVQDTEFGKVGGYLANESKTLIWKGIPYAKAPVGDLRWKEPVNPDPWVDVLDATKPGDTGIQVSGTKFIGSENCLNLDIYRPNSDKTGLPVLFFIHGGNNQTGSSGAFNGEQLAVDGNIIVVSINYRLGLFGFNNLPALRTGNLMEDSGNFSVLDFSKALDWVIANITSFGGNPDNITISGHSAGGRDVMALLISPIVEGKFQKAICFSGGMTLADYDDSTKQIAKAIAPIVVEDGIKDSALDAYEWLLTDDSAVKDYLYSLSSERVATLMAGADIRMAVFPHLYNDGTVIPKEGFSTKNYNSVPVIMVTGSNEFSIFALRYPEFKALSPAEHLGDSLSSRTYQFTKKYGGILYGLFNAQESAQRMFDDYYAPIYTCDFEFGDDSRFVDENFVRVYGSYHGVWDPFITRRNSGINANYKDSFNQKGALDLGDKFSAYIKNFLWTGNPNGGGLVKWEPWTSVVEGPTQMLFDADSDKAIIKMTDERVVYQEVLKDMENDKTIPEDVKARVIREVMYGRWFSKGLDINFGNQNMWIQVK